MSDRDESAPPQPPESASAAADETLADHLAREGVDTVAEQATPLEPGPSAPPHEAVSREPEPLAGDEAATGGRHRHGRRGTRRRRKAPWWELPLLVAIAIGVAVLVKTFVIQPFYIPSQSMERTLHGCPGCSDDRILAFKPVYDVRDPHPGDIVVFDAPPGWNEGPPPTAPSNPFVRAFRSVGQFIGFVPPDDLVLVKRVIATGGQTIRGSTDASGRDVVQISDHGAAGPWRTLDEPFVFQDGPDPRGTFGPVTVPKGRLWVMGDHRNDSADSRFHCGVGGDAGGCNPVTSTVPITDVIGKAIVIAWPPSRWRTLGTPATFTAAALGAGGALPVAGGAAVVLPLWLVRRRRRARGRPRAPSPAR